MSEGSLRPWAPAVAPGSGDDILVVWQDQPADDYWQIVARHASLPAPASSPTGTPSITPTPLAGDRYLFVERWQNQERGPGCRILPPPDSPTYAFDGASGVLRVFRGNPRLEIGDIGYFGIGDGLSGMGSGALTRLLRIDALPFEVWGGDRPLRLLSVSDTGAVRLRAENEDIPLAAGTDRRWEQVGPGEEPGCVVTTTLRITNFGYQDRAKIEYR